MKMVRVEWSDSCSPARMWQGRGYGKRMRPSLITSVGFLRRKSRAHVTIMQSIDPCNEGNLLCIPRSCVKSIKKLK